MAFNYFPATYQPYFPAQQSIAPAQSIIWVGSDAEADAYPIAPNNAVTLWNRAVPVVYFKQADASGRPTLKSYDLVERTRTPQDGLPPSGDNSPVYATKEEADAITAAIEAIKTDIKTIKKNMRRKVEDDDE